MCIFRARVGDARRFTFLFIKTYRLSARRMSVTSELFNLGRQQHHMCLEHSTRGQGRRHAVAPFPGPLAKLTLYAWLFYSARPSRLSLTHHLDM